MHSMHDNIPLSCIDKYVKNKIYKNDDQKIS